MQAPRETSVQALRTLDLREDCAWTDAKHVTSSTELLARFIWRAPMMGLLSGIRPACSFPLNRRTACDIKLLPSSAVPGLSMECHRGSSRAITNIITVAP